MGNSVKRLYDQFKPKNYSLTLSIHPDKQSFEGKVSIEGMKSGRPTKRLTLHQKRLKITSARLFTYDRDGEETEVAIARTLTHDAYDELRLHTSDSLYPGSYRVELSFSGEITRNMDGIYPCFFTKENEEKQLIATQFESHHAREAFPCIDEPEAKAVFQLTLEHASSETALSNTNVQEESQTDGRTLTTFWPTPIMSTYLLAFVVGELRSVERKSTNGTLIRAFATPEQSKHLSFALDTAVRAMDFYEEYYAIPFPLEKCDFVALPDFASGAMENWGLITFREQCLLYDEEHTSLSTKQYVAIVICHELTHQWFGNLVTMRWWTDLWLNEGFASWMEYLAVDELFPSWHIWTQFATDDQQIALKADSLEHTHPVEVPVRHPDEIRTIFDTISYMKGASVIHMLQHYLGADAFRDGLRHYLKKYAYKNTDTVDLWSSLEEVTGKPVKEFMSHWTAQAGYPLINVTSKDDHVHLEQQRFVTNPKSEARNDKQLWPVPLLSNDLSQEILVKKAGNVPYRRNQTPVLINEGQTGFYRVSYDAVFQKRQVSALRARTISDIDRMGLLSDAFESTKAGYRSVTEYLNLLQHYEQESSLAVWEIMAASLGSIRQVLSRSDKDDELREAMKPFIISLAEEEHARLGWGPKKDEAHLDSLLRPLILSLAASANEPDTIAHIKELYEDRLQEKGSVHPDIRATVYTTIARLGGEKEFGELTALYQATDSSDEKLALTAALTSFEDVSLHQKALSYVTDGTVRLQDVGYWIAYGFMNRHGRLATWQWLQENWKWLDENTGTDLSFARTPVYAARNFADPSLQDSYKAFFEKMLTPALERSYQQGLEIMETNIAWRQRDSEAAIEWFTARLKK